MPHVFLCGGDTFVLMLLLFGIPWLAEAPEGDRPSQASPLRADADIALTVWDGQELRQMTMAEYLPGVVGGRCPPPSPAGAGRSGCGGAHLHLLPHGRRPQDAHPEADVCTSSACCSAYVSQEDAAARWGDKAEEYETKVQQAVRDTDGRSSFL